LPDGGVKIGRFPAFERNFLRRQRPIRQFPKICRRFHQFERDVPI
jgi:hypothetical protein